MKSASNTFLFPALLRRFLCGAIFGAALLATSLARAGHLEATQLLPRKTLAFVQIPSVPKLVASFQETNMGRMIADPQIQPFVTGLFQAADNALAEVKEVTGLSLSEIAAIPQGEITLAMIPLDEIPDSDPMGFVGIVDCGDNIESARKFANTLRERIMKQEGAAQREEIVDGVGITVLVPKGADVKSPLVMLERDNTMVVCSNLESAKLILARWTEGHEDCLAKNRKFTSIMDRCRGTKDEEPQFRFYADPIAIAYQVTRDNMAARIGMAIVPSLGLDGLKAVGGSFVFASEEFDGIMHLHVQLGVPRNGLIDLIAIGSGDDTPPRWVPADVLGYVSIHWNFDQSYDKGIKLWDSFQGEGAGAKALNGGAQRALGLSLEQDILPALTGRIVHITWIKRPVQFPASQQQMYAFQLRDPAAFTESFNKMVAYFGDRFEKKSVNGVTYYHWARGADNSDDSRPDPSFALWQDWILASDWSGILEHIISQGEVAENPLASALEYKLIASRIAQQPGGDRPGMLVFGRPDEQWKYFYELAASEKTRDALKDQSTKNPDNPFFTALNQGLSQNPLPPWEVIAKYLAPEGSMLIEDPSGIHYMAFALRRK